MKNQKNNPFLWIVGSCILALGFSSCTSLQQAASTASDDLYAMPSTNTKSTKQTIASSKYLNTTELESSNQEKTDEEYEAYENYQDDRFLRLKVANRNRWSTIDDWGYWNNPRFSMRMGVGFGGWNNWNNWGGWGWDPFWGGGFGGFGMGFGGWAGQYGGWGGFGLDPFWGGGFGGFGGFGGWGGGFGFDPFWGGGFGYGGWGGGFGYGGWGGGFGYGGWGGGFGYGGWGGGFWNPYRPIYFVGQGFPIQGRNYTPRAMQTSRPALASYRNNNYNNNFSTPSNRLNGRTNVNNNNFGSLANRVNTSNVNAGQAMNNERSTRYFKTGVRSTPINSNNNSTNNRASFSTPRPNNMSDGGRTGGFNSSGFSGGSSSSSRPARSGRGN